MTQEILNLDSADWGAGMTKDDYSVIVYKILAYLYACLRKGKTPDPADYSCNSELFQIPQSYWESIMEELINEGYIKGAYALNALGQARPVIRVDSSTSITMKGAEYLDHNSVMQRIKEFLGAGFQTVLANVIGSLV